MRKNKNPKYNQSHYNMIESIREWNQTIPKMEKINHKIRERYSQNIKKK